MAAQTDEPAQSSKPIVPGLPTPLLAFSGPLVTLAVVLAELAFSRWAMVVPSPAVLFVVPVVYAGLVSGLAPAILSALIAYGGIWLAIGLDLAPGTANPLAVRMSVNAVAYAAVVWFTSLACARMRALASAPARVEREVFKTIIDNLHDAILECDWQGIRDVNASFCRMTGFAREELLGCRPPYPFWPADQYAAIAASLEHAMRGKALDFELVLTRKNGQRFPVLLSVSRLTDAGPNTRVVYTFRDITALKAAEQAARASEARFQLFMDNCPVAAFVKDGQGRFILANRAWAVAVGLPIERVLGRTLRELSEDLGDPQMAPQAEESDAAARSSAGRVERIQRLRGPDGKLHDHLVIKFPIPTANGEQYLGGMVLDVTERQRAQSALAESESRLKLALNAARMATWVWDIGSGVIVGSERFRELYGLPAGPEQMTIPEFGRAVHPEDLRPLHDAVQQALDSGSEYRFEYRVVHPGGQIRWISARGHAEDTPVLDDVNRTPPRVKRVLRGVSMDVTDRKLAEEALRASEARLGVALEAAGLGAFDWDLSSRTAQVSAALPAMFGLPPGTVDLDSYFQAMHPEDAPRVRALVDQAILEPARTQRVEYRVRRPDGSWRWVAGHGRALRREDGTVHLVGIIMELHEPPASAAS